ncbi:dentin sialophosphoprotein-like [Mytilus edulis]|uniref:dentin sialophosphoprotein-like n=1 Tax=Mytilus edulis TaxID=6550 RepID=UPI0039F0323C
MDIEEESSNCGILDLYGDLITDENIQKHEDFEELDKNYKEALDRITSLEKDLDESRNTEMELKKKIETLEKNSSALLITARAELQRKDRELASLRRSEGNDGVSLFRKRMHHQNFRQRRESSNSPSDSERQSMDIQPPLHGSSRKDNTAAEGGIPDLYHFDDKENIENDLKQSRKRKHSTEMENLVKSDSKKYRYENARNERLRASNERSRRHDTDQRLARGSSVVPHSSKQDTARRLLQKSKKDLRRKSGDLMKHVSSKSNLKRDKVIEHDTKHSERESQYEYDKNRKSKSQSKEKETKQSSHNSKDRSSTPDKRPLRVDSPSIKRVRKIDERSPRRFERSPRMKYESSSNNSRRNRSESRESYSKQQSKSPRERHSRRDRLPSRKRNYSDEESDSDLKQRKLRETPEKSYSMKKSPKKITDSDKGELNNKNQEDKFIEKKSVSRSPDKLQKSQKNEKSKSTSTSNSTENAIENKDKSLLISQDQLQRSQKNENPESTSIASSEKVFEKKDKSVSISPHKLQRSPKTEKPKSTSTTNTTVGKDINELNITQGKHSRSLSKEIMEDKNKTESKNLSSKDKNLGNSLKSSPVKKSSDGKKQYEKESKLTSDKSKNEDFDEWNAMNYRTITPEKRSDKKDKSQNKYVKPKSSRNDDKVLEVESSPKLKSCVVITSKHKSIDRDLSHSSKHLDKSKSLKLSKKESSRQKHTEKDKKHEFLKKENTKEKNIKRRKEQKADQNDEYIDDEDDNELDTEHLFDLQKDREALLKEIEMLAQLNPQIEESDSEIHPDMIEDHVNLSSKNSEQALNENSVSEVNDSCTKNQNICHKDKTISPYRHDDLKSRTLDKGKDDKKESDIKIENKSSRIIEKDKENDKNASVLKKGISNDSAEVNSDGTTTSSKTRHDSFLNKDLEDYVKKPDSYKESKKMSPQITEKTHKHKKQKKRDKDKKRKSDVSNELEKKEESRSEGRKRNIKETISPQQDNNIIDDIQVVTNTNNVEKVQNISNLDTFRSVTSTTESVLDISFNPLDDFFVTETNSQRVYSKNKTSDMDQVLTNDNESSKNCNLLEKKCDDSNVLDNTSHSTKNHLVTTEENEKCQNPDEEQKTTENNVRDDEKCKTLHDIEKTDNEVSDKVKVLVKETLCDTNIELPNEVNNIDLINSTTKIGSNVSDAVSNLEGKKNKQESQVLNPDSMKNIQESQDTIQETSANKTLKADEDDIEEGEITSDSEDEIKECNKEKFNVKDKNKVKDEMKCRNDQPDETQHHLSRDKLDSGVRDRKRRDSTSHKDDKLVSGVRDRKRRVSTSHKDEKHTEEKSTSGKKITESRLSIHNQSEYSKCNDRERNVKVLNDRKERFSKKDETNLKDKKKTKCDKLSHEKDMKEEKRKDGKHSDDRSRIRGNSTSKHNELKNENDKKKSEKHRDDKRGEKKYISRSNIEDKHINKHKYEDKSSKTEERRKKNTDELQKSSDKYDSKEQSDSHSNTARKRRKSMEGEKHKLQFTIRNEHAINDKIQPKSANDILHEKDQSVLKHDSLQPGGKCSSQGNSVQLSYKHSSDLNEVEDIQVHKKENSYSALQIDSKDERIKFRGKDTAESLAHLKSDSVHKKYKQFDIEDHEMHEDVFEHEKTSKEKHDHKQYQSDNEKEFGNIQDDNELSLKRNFEIKEITGTKKNVIVESDSYFKSKPHISANKEDLHLNGNEKEIVSDSNENIRKSKAKQRHRRKSSTTTEKGSRKNRDMYSDVEIKEKATSSTEEIQDGKQINENFMDNIQNHKTVWKEKDIEKGICEEKHDMIPEIKSIIARTDIEYKELKTYSKDTNTSDISYLKALVTPEDTNVIKDSRTSQESDEDIDIDIVDIENLDEDNCYEKQSDQLRQVSESMLACSCARMRIWHRQPKHGETNITIEHCEIQKEGVQRQNSGDDINIDEMHTSDASESVSDSQTYDESYCASRRGHVSINIAPRVVDYEKQAHNKQESSESSTDTENNRLDIYNKDTTTVGTDSIENVTNKTVELLHLDLKHLDESESCHQGLKQGYKIPKIKPSDKKHGVRHKEDKKEKRSEVKELKHKHKSRSIVLDSERTKDDKHDKEKRFDERSNEISKQRTVDELRKLHRCISLHDDESSKTKKIKSRSISSDKRLIKKSDLQYQGDTRTSQRQTSHSTEFRESKRE